MQQIYQISRLELEVLMLNQLFFKKELLKYMMLFLIPVMFKKYFFLKKMAISSRFTMQAHKTTGETFLQNIKEQKLKMLNSERN